MNDLLMNALRIGLGLWLLWILWLLIRAFAGQGRDPDEVRKQSLDQDTH